MRAVLSSMMRAVALLAASLLAAPPAGFAQAPAPGGSGRGEFHFESLNGRYRQLAPHLESVERGGLTIALSSPSHQLELTSNRLVLIPRPDGAYDARLDLEFSGRGQLVAELAVSGGASSRLEDEIVVPAQERTLSARVRIRPSPEGYLVTPETLPETFEVAIRSRLGSRLVAACAPLAVLGLVPVDCDGLARAFSSAAIPMPPPGETYVLEAARLSAEERRRFDAFLTGGAGSAARR